MNSSFTYKSALLLPVLLSLQGRIAQKTRPAGKLAIEGRSGRTHLVQIHGKPYVEIEALARVISDSPSFLKNLITLIFLLSPPVFWLRRDG